jgi:hypothetical protein
MQSDGVPLWSIVDTAWYRSFYPIVESLAETKDEDGLIAAYHQFGKQLGHSPNPYFHETWYLQQYPDVRKSVLAGDIASGFDHYCLHGRHERAPHWLFSPSYYAKQIKAKYHRPLTPETDGNDYEHFLRAGQFQGLSGHWLFDATVVEALCSYAFLCEAQQNGPYSAYLKQLGLSSPEANTSLFFDPSWYLAAYPQVRRGITENLWGSALEHYMTNDQPADFDPSPRFSEQAYLQAYGDVREGIQSAYIRNGYEHYCLYGKRENRRFFPSAVNAP